MKIILMLPERIPLEDRARYFNREWDLMKIMNRPPLGEGAEIREVKYRLEEDGRMCYIIQDWTEGKKGPAGHESLFAEDL